MQTAIQIADCNAPRLTPANLSVENSRGEIELRSPLERKSTLANIAFILGGIECDCHSLIVYAIYAWYIREVEGALAAASSGWQAGQKISRDCRAALVFRDQLKKGRATLLSPTPHFAAAVPP
jgi:hypothetical protein